MSHASGFRTISVEDACEQVSVGIVIQPSQYYTDEASGVKAFRSANIGSGRINDRNWVYISQDGHKKNRKSELKAGDVLVVRSGAPGTSCVVTNEFAGSNCIDIVFARPKKNIVTPEYLSLFTNSEVGKRQIAATQGGLALKHFNVGAYKKMIIDIPGTKEQATITSLLSSWDFAIEKAERLIAAKENSYSWYIRTLIDDNCSNWKHLRADKIFKSVSEKGNGGAELLSVTQARGVIPRTMLEGRVMSPEGGTDSYKLIKKGDFAISLRSFQGGIEYSQYQGLISPAYTVLRPKIELHDEFYRHFFKSYLFIEKYLSIAVIGIRDGKQISIPDFMTVKIPLPPIDQQKEIASILNTARQEIDLLKKQAEAYRKQKRGLMQRLLTGEWRVRTGKEAA